MSKFVPQKDKTCGKSKKRGEKSGGVTEAKAPKRRRLLKLREEMDEEEEEPPREAVKKVLSPGKGKSPLEQLREEIGRQDVFSSSSVPIVTPSYRRIASPMDSGSDAKVMRLAKMTRELLR